MHQLQSITSCAQTYHRNDTHRRLGRLAAHAHRRAGEVVLRLLALAAHHVGIRDRLFGRSREGTGGGREPDRRGRADMGDDGALTGGGEGAGGPGQGAGGESMKHGGDGRLLWRCEKEAAGRRGAGMRNENSVESGRAPFQRS